MLHSPLLQTQALKVTQTEAMQEGRQVTQVAAERMVIQRRTIKTLVPVVGVMGEMAEKADTGGARPSIPVDSEVRPSPQLPILSF
jgi:hypothetical protein